MSSNFFLTQNAKLLCQAIQYYHSLLQGAQQAPHCRLYLIHVNSRLLVSRMLPVERKHKVGYSWSVLDWKQTSCSQGLCRHIIKAPGLHCLSFKMVNTSIQKASPFTVLQTPWAEKSSPLYVSAASLLLRIRHQ